LQNWIALQALGTGRVAKESYHNQLVLTVLCLQSALGRMTVGIDLELPLPKDTLQVYGNALLLRCYPLVLDKSAPNAGSKSENGNPIFSSPRIFRSRGGGTGSGHRYSKKLINLWNIASKADHRRYSVKIAGG
jgi:hypothetical protein